MKPRRIMHISTRLILGGSQENTVLSCEGQADDGHTVSLVYGPIEGPEGSMRERAAAHGGIELIETPDMVRELSPRRDFRCARALRRLIRDWKPDVVHTHSSKAGILGRSAAWRERVPAVVHTIHGLAFHPYQSAWRNRIYITAERWAAKRCHRILCVANAMRDQSRAVGIGRPEQYERVWSGMETEAFLDPPEAEGGAVDLRAKVRGELGLAHDAFVIGTVSRLAELKGHDDILEAVRPLLERDPNVHLLWVGDGYWRKRLLDRVRDMGLEGRVVTTGLVPPDAIPRYHRAMDVLVHASYREGLPRVVTQGMLSGLPVVANDVDGTREVCIGSGSGPATGPVTGPAADEPTGWLTKPGNIDSLRTAIEEVRANPDAARERAARGRKFCRERFGKRVMVDHLQRVYSEILNESLE